MISGCLIGTYRMRWTWKSATAILRNENERVKACGWAELYALEDAQKEIMVMRELPEPKKAYVLTRGEYTINGPKKWSP